MDGEIPGATCTSWPKTDPAIQVIVETKGYDPLAEVKSAAADRWVKAVNAEGSYGQWAYAMARKTTEVISILNRVGEEEMAAPKS